MEQSDFGLSFEIGLFLFLLSVVEGLEKQKEKEEQQVLQLSQCVK
jgi:hypothetical protein